MLVKALIINQDRWEKPWNTTMFRWTYLSSNQFVWVYPVAVVVFSDPPASRVRTVMVWNDMDGAIYLGWINSSWNRHFRRVFAPKLGHSAEKSGRFCSPYHTIILSAVRASLPLHTVTAQAWAIWAIETAKLGSLIAITWLWRLNILVCVNKLRKWAERKQ